ncbi:hypothetical protein LCGC14_0362400 [marine sediment metagenome]|uniref:Uncharacterized protein n=1 Tax=marine sediment metagenome TaxID=412755 RepID=A0A0F9TQR6_9ZZZZ
MEDKPSRISERKCNVVAIMGYDTFHTTETVGRIEFYTKGCVSIQVNPFFMRSSLGNTIELSEKTARAFANEILRRCDMVKKAKAK